MGIREVTLVCGYHSKQIHSAIDSYSGEINIHLTFNPFYSVADNLISLWAARAQMDEDFVLINGDNVFSPDVLPLLAHNRMHCCVMVRQPKHYDDDDMKVCIRNNQICRIGKKLSAAETSAVSVGIMQFAGPGVHWLSCILEECVMAGNVMRAFFPSAIQRIIDQGHHVSYVDIGQFPCADVDTLEDLKRVRENIDLFTRSEFAMPNNIKNNAVYGKPV